MNINGHISESLRAFGLLLTLAVGLGCLFFYSAVYATPHNAPPNQLRLDRDGPVSADQALEYAMSAYKAGDFGRAATWSRKAARGGNVLGQHTLGTMYAKGVGVDVDNAKAMKWWALAAAQGDAKSLFNMGVMHARGHGMETDLVQAYKFLLLSKVLGYEGALTWIGRLTPTMTVAQVAEAEGLARKWAVKFAAD